MHLTRWRIILFLSIIDVTIGHELDVKSLRKQAYDMFMHGYKSYMNYAFPADELMPLSCKGRVRGQTPSRGDVDDTNGNFSLTLLDSMDTLVVLNELDEFEKAVDFVIHNVRFDSDYVVSVFETNIRVLGGLISAHVLAELVKEKHPTRLKTYNKQLLRMAQEVGNRLLPAFNTTTGLPYSRISLRHGMTDQLKKQKDTCTACGGTMILEFAALSRLSGDPIYEQKARKAMDFLFEQRHRSSDLMGTVLNVHSGDWVRRESGIGAGIDSYYEYCLKAYILLGDISYLERFNKHYEAITKYLVKGPLMVDVHMHRPTVATRAFMDALLAFWPGLQVLKGDVKQAIELHEMLYQVIQKHKFLPEAFTHELQVHWAEHPIRPEFVESTYFLYRATKDPHYLHVAKQIMDSINDYVKVPCGFAALKDIRTMAKEDQMESFVLSETFKYLYLIFTDPSDLIFNPDHFVLTTEAHFLPLSMGENKKNQRRVFLRSDEKHKHENYVCANPMDFTKLPLEMEEAQLIRERTKILLGELKGGTYDVNGKMVTRCDSPNDRVRAWSFSTHNADHVKQLSAMGIELVTQSDGRVHLTHQSANAATVELAYAGVEFMREMQELVDKLEGIEYEFPRGDELFLQFLSSPFFGKPPLYACHAQFGRNLQQIPPVVARVVKAQPFRACETLANAKEVEGKIVVVERANCVFQDKARRLQAAGAVGMIVIDHEPHTKFILNKAPFSMGIDRDGIDNVLFPSIFLFRAEGEELLKAMSRHPEMVISMADTFLEQEELFVEYLRTGKAVNLPSIPQCSVEDGDIVQFNVDYPEVVFNLRFNGINQDSDPRMHQEVVERHVTELQKYLDFETDALAFKFYEFFRTAAYGALDLNVAHDRVDKVLPTLMKLEKGDIPPSVYSRLPGDITQVRCAPKNELLVCTKIISFSPTT